MKKLILISALFVLATSAWAEGDKKEHWVSGKGATEAQAIGETEVKAAAAALKKGTCYAEVKTDHCKENKDKKHWVCKTKVEEHKDQCDGTKIKPTH